jgi:hypothetical protein
MKNVTDGQDRARLLWTAAKFPGEFGARNTTALKADAQVVVLICGHLAECLPSGRQSTVRSQKGSLGFTAKCITGNRAAGNAAGMTGADRDGPARSAADGH